MKLVIFDDKDPEIFKIIIDYLKKNDNVELGQQKITSTADGDVDIITPKQIWKLKHLGFKGDFSKFTKKEASDKISELGG